MNPSVTSGAKNPVVGEWMGEERPTVCRRRIKQDASAFYSTLGVGER